MALPSGGVADVFRAKKTDLCEELKAAYSYLYIRTDTQSDTYYRIMLKYKEPYDYETVENMILNSFKIIEKYGITANNDDYEYPAIPNYWNEETKEYYNYLCNSDTTQWGLYYYQNHAGLERENYLESLVDSKFDLVMYYISMPNLEFDINFAQRAYEEDKVVVLTLRYQYTADDYRCFPFDITFKWQHMLVLRTIIIM